MIKMKQMQQRVFNWQRLVADQPVCKDCSQRDITFIGKQLGFVRSEWFDEYIPHATEYNAIISQVEDAISEDTCVAKLLEDADKLRESVADDIGDVAFTLLGLLNAHGIELSGEPSGRLTHCSVARREASISHDIERLDREPRAGVLVLVESALTDLAGIANHYGISFYAALEAVCDSNDTKLWTKAEVDLNEEKAKQNGWTIVEVRGLTDAYGMSASRRFRVKNSDSKLMKSPSYTPPNLENAISGYALLT